ncbi:hypothetical protein F0562_004445 [Nyssa sinensis]|uniref:Uncharacterized protein n=1 Tax=Nyssa sinensis TaxID=561372 RepID=A0A5J5BZD5_9ASTE|nr:hypothetical protein F0562_004445 [Nyssa sinensis]
MEGKNPMAWNNPGYDGETTSLLPSFTYFLLASNAYQRLPPHQKSRTKDFWKFSICSYEKRKFSDSSSPDEKADNKKIKHSDSILEMILDVTLEPLLSTDLALVWRGRERNHMGWVEDNVFSKEIFKACLGPHPVPKLWGQLMVLSHSRPAKHTLGVGGIAG